MKPDPSDPSPPPTLDSFDEFWPHYLRQHAAPANRVLHLAGTSMGLAAAALAVVRRRPGWLLAAPVIGYAPAWIGHLLVERNRPATFGHPLWALRADLKMTRLAITGRLGRELRRHHITPGPPGPDTTPRANAPAPSRTRSAASPAAAPRPPEGPAPARRTPNG